MDVDAAGDLLAALALQQVHEAGGELDVLDAAADLALRVREHLAVLAREDRGQLVLTLDQQLAEPEEHVRALDQPGGAPRREGRLGGRDGGLDLVGGGERDLGGDLAGGGVEDRSGAICGTRLLAGDHVADERHGVPLGGFSDRSTGDRLG
ncbi:hypothetical protein GCM10017607_33670 [Microbacterium thalassium]|nr:hypothetical protein GCM10017607_33670 [Microbacterium thalassium]